MGQGSMKDRVALIAGADDEVGEAIALQFAAHGAKLALCGGARDRLEALAAKVVAQGGKAMTSELNPGAGAIASCVGGVLAHYGKIDILVNNLPLPAGNALCDPAAGDFDTAVSAVLGARFHFMRETLPAMKKNGYGRIVNLSSLAYLGQPKKADAAAAQAGVFGLTRSVALEAARDSITVNHVVKGDVSTAQMSEEEKEKLAASIPVKRVGAPADVARAVCFFAADSSKYVTGQTFFVCGGKSAYFSMSI